LFDLRITYFNIKNFIANNKILNSKKSIVSNIELKIVSVYLYSLCQLVSIVSKRYEQVIYFYISITVSADY